MQRQKCQKQTTRATRIIYESITCNMAEPSHNRLCGSGSVVLKFPEEI